MTNPDHPVDSTTRECCSGIGRYAPTCTPDTSATSNLTQLPLRAGAIKANEWRRAPNDHGYSRWFDSRVFPVMDWLRVRTGGIEIVEDSGAHTIARQVHVDADSDPCLFHEGAVKLADALMEAAVYLVELERTDKAGAR